MSLGYSMQLMIMIKEEPPYLKSKLDPQDGYIILSYRFNNGHCYGYKDLKHVVAKATRVANNKLASTMIPSSLRDRKETSAWIRD